MNDLISRSALIEEINTQRKLAKTSYPKRSFVVGDTIQCIYEAPVVDAVPVVRCKDCAWGIVSARNPLIKWCNKHATHFKDNDFCSYGERRDGDATD